MNENTLHPIPAQLPARWHGLTNQVLPRILTFRGRGFISLLVLFSFLVPTMAMLFPMRVTPASAPASQFSAERAWAHLEVIAREPHPQGSPALAQVRDYLAQQLASAGLEVNIQRTAGLQNVVARLRGTDSTGAIVILTHYDTVSYSLGAGDNSSTVAALVETMRALAAGSAPRNDIIALFHDGEEDPDIMAGSRAFIRSHPWMDMVQVAISIDSSVAGPISVNETGPDNGWLLQALARAYHRGVWTSFSGGGMYNSTPFRDAGILVLALEDNYPFRQKHTAEDIPSIIRPASVQQMGDQTLAIAHELGRLDLSNPYGETETFFPTLLFGLAHYPQAWALPLASSAAVLLVLAMGLALWRKIVSWRGLLVALGAILGIAAISGLGVNEIKPYLPKVFGWQTFQWQEWPEVIPPNGGLAAAGLGLLVLGVVVAGYLLVRRWCARSDFSLAGLIPFAIPAVILAIKEPRTAYAFTWPVLLGSLGWIAAGIAMKRQGAGWLDFSATFAALPMIVIVSPFLPGVIMSDGMKSLEIIAVFEVALLAVILPAIDGLLRRPRRERTERQ